MYEVRKGWPCEGALDETLMPATPGTISEGMMAAINATGKIEPANFTAAASATDPLAGLIIGVDAVTGKCTMLMSDCIVECDSEHFEAAAYTPNMPLTAKAGKFAKATNECVVAHVLAYDSVNQKLRAMVHASGPHA